MFGSKKKKKAPPAKEKKPKAATAKPAAKKTLRSRGKTFLRPIKEPKTAKKKVPKEVVEDYKKPAFVRKEIKLQSKKILTAEGWKRLLKDNSEV